MKKRQRRILTFIIVIVAVVGLSLVFINRRVRGVIDGGRALYVMFKLDSDLLMSTPAGRYYRALYWKNNDELMRIYLKYPRFAPENGTDFMVLIDMYMPAMDALVFGHGDTVTINAEQVEAAQKEFEWMASVAEPSFRDEINGELDRFPLQTFTGMTAQQAWDYVNANWVPRTPEEQAMSELTARTPPTPDYAAHKLDSAVRENVGFSYPAGWSLTSPDPGTDPSNWTIFFDPPGVDPSGSPSLDRITLRVWPLPLEERGSLDPAFSDPSDGGYAVLWSEDLVIGDMHGVKYVWGQPSGSAILYARLYSEDWQLAIQLSVAIKDPEDLKAFGYRWTLGTQYVPFDMMVSNLRLVSSPTETLTSVETPTSTETPTPVDTPTPVETPTSADTLTPAEPPLPSETPTALMPSETGTYFVTDTPTP